MSRISVIIPAFNQPAKLARSLASLRAQTVQPHEIIIVDDGSKTPIPPQEGCIVTRIEREPVHRGSSAAKNHGARLATGNYLCFADSDILHVPDAMQSIELSLPTWESNTLIDVFRISLPRGYHKKYYADMDRLESACGDILIDPDMERASVCWEQNCGVIRRDYFWSLGGYDESGFPSWGFNNQDLCARVILDGGHVTSAIKRLSTDKRLYCYHIWHRAPRGEKAAKREWIAKWGEEFSATWMRRLYALAESGDVSQYQHNIRRAA